MNQGLVMHRGASALKHSRIVLRLKSACRVVPLQGAIRPNSRSQSRLACLTGERNDESCVLSTVVPKSLVPRDRTEFQGRVGRVSTRGNEYNGLEPVGGPAGG